MTRDGAAPLIEPLCGRWAGMDDHWTEEPEGVTCADCRDLLRARRLAGAQPAVARP